MIVRVEIPGTGGQEAADPLPGDAVVHLDTGIVGDWIHCLLAEDQD